jgi:XapX domain-containing protein
MGTRRGVVRSRPHRRRGGVAALFTYVISLGAGLLVGAIYALLGVRSPAPPVVALVGLLGILLGEQIVPVAKRLLGPAPAGAASLRTESVEHLFGLLPGRGLGGANTLANRKTGDQA